MSDPKRDMPVDAQRIEADGAYLKEHDGTIVRWSHAHEEWIPLGHRPFERWRMAVPLMPKVDPINHPDHYASGDIECIDAIRAALTDEEFRGYCKGNMLKYVWRERKKGGVESLKKCGWYLDRLISEAD